MFQIQWMKMENGKIIDSLEHLIDWLIKKISESLWVSNWKLIRIIHQVYDWLEVEDKILLMSWLFCFIIFQFPKVSKLSKLVLNKERSFPKLVCLSIKISMLLPKEFNPIVPFAKPKCNDISYQQAAKGNWQKLLMILNKCKLNIDKKTLSFLFLLQRKES